MDVISLLKKARALKASDLHLALGERPYVRRNGLLEPLTEEKISDEKELAEAGRELLGKSWEEEEKKLQEKDFAFALSLAGEEVPVRGNAFRQRSSWAFALRLLPSRPPSWQELGLPEAVGAWTRAQGGLILVAGPTGSGKSTTLAALIDKINRERACHIITLEDPIEYRHRGELALIAQRELGRDTRDFASGLRSALRQDPDVLLIGELREKEAMTITLQAAETGHLCLATVHASSTVEALGRILDALPKEAAAAQLAAVLVGAVSQRLLPKKEGGRAAAFEVLTATPALRNLIRQRQLHQVPGYIETGSRYGMVTMAAALEKLRREGVIE